MHTAIKQVLLALWLSCSIAFFDIAGAVSILPVDEVFIPKVSKVDDQHITINITIKPNHYIYRQRLQVQSLTPSLAIDGIALSAGERKSSSSGEQSVWIGGQNPAVITLSYRNPERLKKAQIALRYQGCQQNAVCYPPTSVTLSVQLPVVSTNFSSGRVAFEPFAENDEGYASVLTIGENQQPRPRASIVHQPKVSMLGDDKAAQPGALPVDKAFPFVVTMVDANVASINWDIPEGYYVYQRKIAVQADDNTINQLQLSKAQSHQDQFFGEQMVYRGDAGKVQAYFSKPMRHGDFYLQFQGCADQGICYPVAVYRISIKQGKVVAVNADDTMKITMASLPQQKLSATGDVIAGAQTAIQRTLQTLLAKWWLGLGILLLAGIALAFTPCVLPMLPILLGILTNQRQVSAARAFVLSSAYGLGVASAMAIVGLLVAGSGVNIQIVFQKPLWLLLFAGIFILLGLAMFGVFNVAMPSRVQTHIIQIQNRLQTARPLNLYITGALSILVVGPCVAPPLIAILAFIATTDNRYLGALYLFTLGVGMSLPLVFFSLFMSRLPKAGALSTLMTRVFALMMFAVSLWLLSRLLPGALSLSLWGLLLLGFFYCCWKTPFVNRFAKALVNGVALAGLAIGLLWIVGGVLGNSNPLRPLTKVVPLPFVYIYSREELAAFLARTKKPVMLDVYADWCASCQEVEHTTFNDEKVRKAFAHIDLLKFDMTANDRKNIELIKQLGLVGPPAFLFFANAQELSQLRHIGIINAQQLLDKLEYLKKIEFVAD